ncbi:hypothetical protein ABE444_04640 [Brevundimonas pondensis]|jgi:hypothetical protein|uniref:Uncharacterized protein n=1 Tax=Brevundimonas pondensis TaxID=2774189 RepID=A0ABX7SRV9_9CAUL|nr:hypothetical protein [Brevundimonas pondensis]QTC89178.1 hypothetical protein IFE19_07580 [Brevundimonas pondensis]
MADDMEHLIRTRLSDEPQLDDLEDAVWSLVDRRKTEAHMGRIQGAAMALALVVGLTNGSLMLLAPKPQPSEMRIFSVAASGLSPLAGMDARR